MPTIPDADPRLTRRQADNIRARIAQRAEALVDLLISHAQGGRDMSPTQVKAIQITLDRVLPSMQAIDQTTHSEQPELGPAELEAMLVQAMRDLGRRDPAALEELVAAARGPRLQVVGE